ncbi:NSP5 [Rotavirus D chicken/05V0049/DEU/2005]|uniref:NSP5 n=1 Tax=Rotavirus D chicken/05V0049/DEU/2005 TaxID=884200 RepID=E2EBV0_9REOV|nr:NSP5 [Rotavirus D chicken/05V0049/DEU/2005]ADN06434.1 NSP5 [Rotavirus D chicken/05V0049/DEU/2005]
MMDDLDFNFESNLPEISLISSRAGTTYTKIDYDEDMLLDDITPSDSASSQDTNQRTFREKSFKSSSMVSQCDEDDIASQEMNKLETIVNSACADEQQNIDDWNEYLEENSGIKIMEGKVSTNEVDLNGVFESKILNRNSIINKDNIDSAVKKKANINKMNMHDTSSDEECNRNCKCCKKLRKLRKRMSILIAESY